MNGDKFVFGEDTVDWAGVRLTEDKCQPLPEHVDAIRTFPVPLNVTNMRSYYTSVNQVAHYYAVSMTMQPDLFK